MGFEGFQKLYPSIQSVAAERSARSSTCVGFIGRADGNPSKSTTTFTEMSGCDWHMAALNFSWLEGGVIAGCRGPRSDNDLEFLRSVGICGLVRLAAEQETGLSSADIQRHAIHDCYEPVSDCAPPSQQQIDRILAFVENMVGNDCSVAVSCGAGYGRTGTILACYLVSKGSPPEVAIEQLITMRPCSREILRVPGQKEAVFEFYRRQNRIVQT
jgi:atypical dual specificity phosphatase